ncbi:hypothetical protein [Tautonia marina]|uniref:hypothetical protein n=1 Tax=Tautonia marina TaxID=2653855 RepID=UPI001260537C|nr:hypothetical protein [Tautonia marina]
MPRPLTLARLTAAILALVVLAWQAGNAAAGRFVHPFLIADLILSTWLLLAAFWPHDRPASLALLSGFGAMLGVFLSAVTARMLAGSLDPGTIAAGLGILPCLLGALLAGRSVGSASSP